jgi:hypothetical protein
MLLFVNMLSEELLVEATQDIGKLELATSQMLQIGLCHRFNKSTDKSSAGFSVLRKQIEMIGIEIKDLNEQAETGRFELKTKFINQNFINELDKIGLQLISIRGTWIGRHRLLHQC